MRGFIQQPFFGGWFLSLHTDDTLALHTPPALREPGIFTFSAPKKKKTNIWDYYYRLVPVKVEGCLQNEAAVVVTMAVMKI